MKEKIQNLRSRIQPVESGLFFTAGFVYDLITVTRIDSIWQMVLHLLLLLSMAISLILRRDYITFGDSIKFHKNKILSFASGSLLSAYMILYFRSVGHLKYAAFIALIGSLMVYNEWRAHRAIMQLRLGLFGFCITSYFVYTVPTLYGDIAPWSFTISLLLSGTTVLLWMLIDSNASGETVRDRISSLFPLNRAVPLILPILVVAGLYSAKLIPPVPLSVKHIGIYYQLEKVGNNYQAETTNQYHQWWPRGEAIARPMPGEKLYVFVQTFAPSNFTHPIIVEWQKKLNDWQTTDEIKIAVIGGREQGFRGYTYKQNHSQGLWRVRVRTRDNRILATLPFEIGSPLERNARETQTVVFKQ